jgi:hypothetical protein
LWGARRYPVKDRNIVKDFNLPEFPLTYLATLLGRQLDFIFHSVRFIDHFQVVNKSDDKCMSKLGAFKNMQGKIFPRNNKLAKAR